MFVRMAWLNLVKHRRRTALIIFAIMISVLVMEVMAGMFEGMRVNFFRNLTRESGHVQIHAQGYSDRLHPWTLDYAIGGYPELIAELRTIDGVVDIEPIIHFGALLEHDGRDLTVGGAGVRPDTAFFRDAREGMYAGSFLAKDAMRDDDRFGGIVISAAIAALLRVKTGDAVNVVVEDSTGSPYYRQYPVAGIFETNSPDFDENTFLMLHDTAAELVYLEEETIEVRIRLSSSGIAGEFRRAAEERLRSPAIPDASGLEIRTWREVHAGITSMIEMMDFFILVMNALVIVVVASVITNAILMNVFERMRVLGTMRAIGLRKRAAGGMILAEGAILGLVGSMFGLAAGIPIVRYFSVNGLDWGGISEAFGMGSSYFYFGYAIHNSLMSALGGVLVALCGSLYAARVGMRFSIMEALRHV